MNTTIRGHDLKAMAAMVLLALVLLLAVVFAVRTASTTSDRGGNPAIRVTSAGGSGIARDPNIERHAEVVAAYQEGGPR